MRILLILLAVVLGGCTAMLLGGSGGGQAGQDVRTSGPSAADGATTTAVRNRLVSDSMLGRYDLDVQTNGGRVTLRGTVGSYSARARAGRLTGEIDGVTSVNNRIQVHSGN